MELRSILKGVAGRGNSVDSTLEHYENYFHQKGADQRKDEYAEVNNEYYNLATDFYEFGWGESFHFAPRYKGESFDASLARHEHFLASRMGLRPGMTVLDLGCGVGGPMRSIARFSGANVIGVNMNDYQIARGQAHTEAAGLVGQCQFLNADFMNLPYEDGSLSGAYAIEATCHAPDKLALYKEIFRVLEPGAPFATYEWCMTERYQAGDPEHERIKLGIEEGDGVPDLDRTTDVLAGLEAAGFDVIEAEDRAYTSDPDFPWYRPLAGTGYSPRELRMKPAGRWITRQAVRFLEAAHIAPKGSVAVSSMLEGAALNLVEGGKRGIFTPMFYFLARKPA